MASETVTPREVLGRLGAEVPAGRAQPELFGDPDAPLQQVAVSWSATVTGMRSRESCLWVVRTHPLFEPPAGWDPALATRQSLPDPAGALAPLRRKLEILRETRSGILFAPHAWDGGGLNARSQALAARLGLGPVTDAPGGGAAVIELDVPAPGREVVRSVLARLGRTHALVTGDLDGSVRRVGVVAGIAAPQVLSRLITGVAVGVVVAGESVEWEAIPYVQDAVTSGQRYALVAIGNAASEDPSGDALATRLRQALPGVDVSWVPIEDAAWTVGELAPPGRSDR